jgi:cytochrome P450
MSSDLLRFVLPLVHRFLPTPGPGGLVNAALSRALGADSSAMVHVTRHLDVMEVLERDDDFSVRLYDEKMTATTGPFYLGMNELARYEPDARVIWRAVRKDDVSLVRRIAAEETARALDRVRPRGTLDVVKDLAEIVPIQFVRRYYGLSAPDPARLLRLFQTTSKYLFAFWSDPGMRDEATTAGHELREMLDADIARRRREGTQGQGDTDVMGRFLSMTDGFSDGDAGIARSLAGLSSGSLNAPFGLFVYAVDKLLGLSEDQVSLAGRIAQAATRGSQADAARFQDWLYEAERFAVYPPFSYRYAERDLTLAAGTPREKRIPRGATVVTWQSLAAFDPDVFDDPFGFVPGRPRWQYMGFGHARHRCLGEHMGQALLEEMARALFALPRLRRAAGRAGQVQTLPVQQGKYPSSLVLDFDKQT